MFRRITFIALAVCFLLVAAIAVSSPRKATAAVAAQVGTTTPTPSAKPDLVIASVVGNQTNLDANGCALNRTNNNLQVIIQNIGTAPAGVFEVSATGRNNVYQAVPSLAVGASITLTFTELPANGVNLITVDSTGLVAESQEGNNVSNFSSPTLSPLCTSTPTPVGYKSPTATRTGTPSCSFSGKVSYDHSGGTGLVNVPLVAANMTGTPNPMVIATTGPYGQYKTGCMMSKVVSAQLGGFTFSPTSITVSSSFPASYFPVGIAAGVPTYTPVPASTNDLLPDLTVLSMGAAPSTPACLNNPYLAVVVKNQGTGAAGAFTVAFNAQTQLVSGLAAGQQITVSFPLNSVIAGTNTATADSTGVIAELNESNNSLSGLVAVPSAGPTCTPTGGIVLTNTRTPTPTITPTFTITRTPTITPTNGATCSPVSATITAPFTKDGVGTFCWQSSNLGGYINSWNTASVTINGVNITNLYVASGSYPAKIGGFWYVTYNGPYTWSHFEAK